MDTDIDVTYSPHDRVGWTTKWARIYFFFKRQTGHFFKFYPRTRISFKRIVNQGGRKT